MSIFSDITDFLSGGNLDSARNFMTGSAASIINVPLPDLMTMIPQLQMQVQQGVLTAAQATAKMAEVQGQMTPEQYQVVQAVVQGTMTPAQASATLQEQSNMAGVKTDQASLQGMRTALAQLGDIAQNKGVTEADRAQFNSIMDQANANVAQQRAAQTQQLQQQGNAGTGSELAARLIGAQGTANSNAIAGANLATSAQQRALQAIQAGVTGNQALNNQLFNQDASKAQAQDLVNSFNAQAKNAVSLANANNQQASNLANFNQANAVNQQNAQMTNAGAAANAAARQASNLANFNEANRVNQVNAQNQTNVNVGNAANIQNANTANFNMANTIAGTNTETMNKQAMMPMQATQQNFTNALNKGTAASTAQNAAGANLAKLGLAQAMMTGNAINSGLSTLNNLSGGELGKMVGGWVKSATGEIGKLVGGIFKPAVSALDKAAGAAAVSAQEAGGSYFDAFGNPYADQASAIAADTANQAAIDAASTVTDAASTVTDAATTVAEDAATKAADTGSWLEELFSDERLKTDKKKMSDKDIDDMMGKMSAYKYRYKGSIDNPTKIGVMAQHMKNFGSSVIDTPAGKKIQGPEALSEALAVLANQHERIKKLEKK